MFRIASYAFCCLLLLSIVAISFAKETTAQGEADDNSRFGIVESYESPAQAARLGISWTRATFHWAEMQPIGPESWQSHKDAQQIESEIDAGRMVVGLLIGIPDWARSENNLPKGLWSSPEQEENLWANYVREMVTRYKGRIDHWIIWNEPDIREGELGHTWDGTVADFAQLQRVAYLTAKKANPESVIHLAAFTYWSDYYAGSEQYMARLLDEIMTDSEAVDRNYYFDIASAHLYFQPDQIYDLLGQFIDIMRERDLNQSIWLVETNAPPKNDPAWLVPNWTLSVTELEQAAYMPQALAAALAAGAERIAVYKLKDSESDRQANPEPFGLVRQDGSERPAFATYRLATDYLENSIRAERERWDEVGQIRVEQPGQTTTVVFSRLPAWQQASVLATSESALLVDIWGTKETITPTNGTYSFDLPPAICSQSIGDYCMIGGPNYYLLQAADVVLATDTPNPSRTPSASNTPAVTATIEPTISSTPTVSSTNIPTATATAAPPKPTSHPTSTFTPTTSTSQPVDQGRNPPSAIFLIGLIGISLLLVLAGGWYVGKRKS